MPNDQQTTGEPGGCSARPACSALEVGKTYSLHHSRFGSATVKVTKLDGEWIDVLVVKGKLRGMTEEWERGDTKTVRECHCHFAPNKD